MQISQCSLLENLARGMRTTQSSTHSSETASSYAVDGDIRPGRHGARCSQTTNQMHPWFRVDLGARATVNEVCADMYFKISSKKHFALKRRKFHKKYMIILQ